MSPHSEPQMYYSKVSHLLVVLLAAAYHHHLAAGEIRHNEIGMDYSFPIPLDRFMFTEKGRLELNITGLSFSSPPPLDRANLSKMGFVISPHGFFYFDDEVNSTVCPLEADNLQKVLTLDKLLLPNLTTTTTRFNFVYSDTTPGPCTLLFVKCPQQMNVSMTVRSAMYNLEDGGDKQRNYLACTTLPMVYYLFSLVYLVLVGVWVRVLYPNMAYASRVHYVMLAVVLLTALNMFFEGQDKWRIMRTGSGDAWELWFYTFSLLKGLSLYTLMLLIASGWKFLKPCLLKREKIVLVAVIGLQCAGNAALVVGHKRAGYYGFDILGELLVSAFNMLSTLAAIVSIKWSINFLLASHTHRRDSFVLKNLKFFRDYMSMSVNFLFLSQTAAFFLELLLSLDKLWIVIASVEGLTVLFYVYTARNFIPQPQELHLLDEEAEAAAREELALCLSVKGIETTLFEFH